jgi:hypothetical protein
MPRRSTYILVEGPHDVEFIGRILRKGPHTFHYQNAKSKVDTFWHPLIPSSYPVGKPPNDFLERVPMPNFFQNKDNTVALQSANGISKIVKRLEETLAMLAEEPDGIGLILDSDSYEKPAKRAADLASKISSSIRNIPGSFPSIPGTVEQSTPGSSRRGIFVFPDNTSQGTLEDLLIECGRKSYPELLDLAESHVVAAKRKLPTPTATWTEKDGEEFKAPSGAKKAMIAAATAILKPGKTSQVSVSDNRWIDPPTFALDKIRVVSNWLENLIMGQNIIQ